MADRKTEPKPDYVSTAEASELLDVRRPYLTQLIREGKLEATRLSPRVYVIAREEVRRYLREKRQFRMGGPRLDGTDQRSQTGDDKKKRKKNT
jgi:excisionase family DNA binding protein